MKQMRAAQYSRYGPPGVLELASLPVPHPAPGEVLVQVQASGLNPKDAALREGTFRRFSGRTFPKGTGFDFAGTVAGLGHDVQDFQVGQRVWGLLDGFGGGAAAEFVVVPVRWVAPMPANLDFTEAAALPLVGLTALQALRDRGRLQAGERLLIKGASGGVGSAAVQLAKALGAHVTALASAPNLAHCRALGADEALDYATFDPADHPRAFDVFLDCYGDTPYRRFSRLLARGGRFVTIAPTPVILLAGLLSRLLPLPRTEILFVRSSRADLDVLGGYVQAGALRMPVQTTYSLEQIREAHAAVSARHARGKRVLLITPGESPRDRTHPDALTSTLGR